jgi:hypothetical protein
MDGHGEKRFAGAVPVAVPRALQTDIAGSPEKLLDLLFQRADQHGLRILPGQHIQRRADLLFVQNSCDSDILALAYSFPLPAREVP